MQQRRRLWFVLAAVVVASFAVLGVVGYKGIQGAPPIPDRVMTADGRVVFDGETIRNGQNVWQSIGGQEIGSIFGHGSYVAPDWTADYLHRESVFILERWSNEKYGKSFASLSAEEAGGLRARLEERMRTNQWNETRRVLTIDPIRVEAFEQLNAHYGAIFADGKKEFAIPRGALTDPVKQREMASFFWWTAWAATTNRPGSDVTYTQNWPPEPLVGNRPSTSAIVWSIASVILLLAGIGGMVWYLGFRSNTPDHDTPADTDPFLGTASTPSQRATMKYFVVVALLWLIQIGLGAIVAHYGVEGDGFFGFPLDQFLPYSIARTWHLQIGIFWIATAWLATGLYIAPAVSGYEPKGQRLGVNILFGALVFVVGGSLTGEWLGINQKLGDLWFWFGHQGYEYVDLGRFWQILLFGGLVFWLWLVGRALLPALKKRDENRGLLSLFVASSIAIPLFYAAGLMYGQRSHIVTAEYWRWWVVHLWVEGFFEVFATVVIAFLFTRLRLIKLQSATNSVLFSTVIFLSGGIIGTFHHLYFTGMPNSVLALGSIFSALELVPLCLIGFEAWENLRLARGTDAAPWVRKYRWPIYFFVAVAFWNFVGAGIFGFLINPPVALYYVQGLNLTPLHGHTALFGVYGMLALGLMLFSLRAIKPGVEWNGKVLGFAFWSINLGLLAMALLSLFPIGVMQAWASIDVGMWYARSPEFMQQPIMQTFRWLRAIGDTLFAIGAVALAYFIFSLLRGDRPEPDAIAIPLYPEPQAD
ncbi:MAG: nitric-oxide reductase large subunit [Thermoanaerobaculia bacterium]